MKCSKCGHELTPGSVFCEYCGTPVPQQPAAPAAAPKCPACGATVTTTEKFCHACGAPLQQVKAPHPQPSQPRTQPTPAPQQGVHPVPQQPHYTAPRRPYVMPQPMPAAADNKIKYIIGGIIVVVAAIGIGLGISSYTHKPAAQPAATTKQEETTKPANDTAKTKDTTEPAAPDTTKPVAADTSVPVSVFKSFHENLTNRRYQGAYNLLSADFQQDMPYNGWVQGYGNTISSTPDHIKVTSISDTQAELQYDLTAKDRDAGRIKVQYFQGAATLVKENGAWKISSMSANKTGESYQ